MSIAATNVRYEHNNSELLRGGLIVKGTFPETGTSVTVKVDSLFDDDLVIPITTQSGTNFSLLQEDIAARVVGVPGTITLIRVDQSENAADQTFSLLIIRKGMGRHLNPGSPNPKLLYNHSNGMYAYQVTAGSAQTQVVSLPGIQLANQDVILVYKTTKLMLVTAVELKASRSISGQSITLEPINGSNFVAGENFIVIVFKGQGYHNPISGANNSFVNPIQGPFGPLDVAGSGSYSHSQATQNVNVPYLNKDSVVIVIPTSAESDPGIIENLSARTTANQPAASTIQVKTVDGGTVNQGVTFDFLVIQTQGRKL